jgi:hypothetical protein
MTVLKLFSILLIPTFLSMILMAVLGVLYLVTSNNEKYFKPFIISLLIFVVSGILIMFLPMTLDFMGVYTK